MKRLKKLWLRLPKWLKWIILAVISFFWFSLLGRDLGGWIFALSVMLAVGFHESGHLLVAKLCGIKIRGFYFIPIGCIGLLDGWPKRRFERFLIAIGGPLAGLILSGIALLLALFVRQIWIRSFALFLMINVVVNLFNLLCLAYPLDGGRVLWQIGASIFGEKRNHWLRIIALTFLSLGIFLTRSPIIILMLFLLFPLWGRPEPAKLGQPAENGDQAGEGMTKTEIAASLMIYLMTVIGFIYSLVILKLLGFI